MISVAIYCAQGGHRCDTYQQQLQPDQVEAWVKAAIAEHGWFTGPLGDHFCPLHNPTERGEITRIGRDYTPLGESGWEARLPDELRDTVTHVGIEIRPCCKEA